MQKQNNGGLGGRGGRPAPATDGLSCRHKLTQPQTEADGAERVGVVFKEGRGRSQHKEMKRRDTRVHWNGENEREGGGGPRLYVGF